MCGLLCRGKTFERCEVGKQVLDQRLDVIERYIACNDQNRVVRRVAFFMPTQHVGHRDACKVVDITEFVHGACLGKNQLLE